MLHDTLLGARVARRQAPRAGTCSVRARPHV